LCDPWWLGFLLFFETTKVLPHDYYVLPKDCNFHCEFAYAVKEKVQKHVMRRPMALIEATRMDAGGYRSPPW
jgi:hypothetical protein